MLTDFAETIALLDRNERAHSLVVAVLVFVSAVFEVASVGMIFPLVQLIVDPSMVHRSMWMSVVYRWSGTHDPRHFVAGCAIVFLAAVIMKSLFNIFLTSYQEWLVHRVSARVGRQLMASYLNSSWITLLQRNSADMINVADAMTGWPLTSAMRSFPTIVTESLITFGILSFLFVIAPESASISLVVLGGALFLSHNAIRRRLLRLSKETAHHATERIRFFQQSLASVKEIKILDRQSRFVEQYAEARDRDAAVLSRLVVWELLPRFIVEPLAVAAMTVVIVVVSFDRASDSANTTAILGLFAVAGVRISPSLTRMLIASNNIRANSNQLRRVREDLHVANVEVDREPGIPVPLLQDKIRGHAVTYRYPTGAKPVLRNLSFEISKGETVGLMGSSGAGKSTLADVILGLLPPDEGHISVDGFDIAGDLKGWQRQVGYVPQSVSLIDASLTENIALGEKPDEIDHARIRRVVSLVRLDDLVSKAPKGPDTELGERGVRLSGGERQRIGIARALYCGRTVLVMDEATSALDDELENEIGEAIASVHGECTVLVIAHRINTLKRCDRIMMLKDGVIVDQGKFEELEKRCPEFGALIRKEEHGAVNSPAIVISAGENQVHAEIRS